MKKIIILSAIFLSVLYFGTFKWLFNSWIYDSHFSHGFLVLAVSIYIAWNNRGEFRVEPYKNGIIIFIIGLILYIIGFIEISPFLSAISFLLVLSGLILYIYGKNTMRALAFPIFFLIFAIPPPFLTKISVTLQSISARYSALILESLGIMATRVGSEIHLQNSSFVIGIPCAGMNTLISLMALAAIFIYLLNCPLQKKALLFGIFIPIAIFSNISRVTSILLIANAYGKEISLRFFHDFSNIFVYIMAFAGLIVISRLTGCKIKKVNHERLS